MPLTTPESGITTQSGNVTQILIAEQANFADEGQVDASSPRVVAANGALSGGDFYKFQPRINSADIAGEGTTIESAFFDGTAAQSQDAPGPIDIANGMSIAMSGNGTALPLRMLTQAKNPTWNIYGGTGQNIPAAVTLVNAAALAAGTASATVTGGNLASANSPVQVVVTPTSNAVVGSSGRATVTLTGTDNWDRTITETIGFRASTASTAATSRLWYKTVTAVSSAGWEAQSGRTYTVTAQDKSAQVIFTPQDDELVAFWTAEVVKGITPNVYNGLVMQSATIDITRDALVAFDCTFLGRRPYPYRNLAGVTTPPADLSTWRTDSSGLEEASADVFAGWQGSLTAENDIRIAMEELTLTFNQELAYTNVLGSQFQNAPPGRDAKRLVSLEATVVYAPQNNYSTYFEGNQPLNNVRLEFNQVGLGSYPYQLALEIEDCQFTADPDPAVADTGTITQTLAMKAVRGRRRTEYLWRTRYSEYDRVRIYT